MVRETRHLWVGNLPETVVREDRIRDQFKRSTEDISPPNFEQRASSYYERGSRLVSETDQYIRRPNSYHTNDIRGRTRDRLYRNGPYSSIIERTTPVGHHRVPSWYDSNQGGTSSVSSGPGQSPASRSVYGNIASAVVQPDTNSSYDLQLIKKKKSRSGSESPCGGTSSSINAASSSHLIERGNGGSGASSRSHSRSPSSCSSTNSTSSNSHASSPVSGSDASTRTRNLQSAVSAPSQSSLSNSNNNNNNNNNNNDINQSSSLIGCGGGGVGGGGSSSSSSSSTGGGNLVVHSEDNRPLAICVRNLPARSSDTSLKDGLFHEYKKHGKVTWVKVVGQNAERYALVCFKKPDDVEKALEVSHDKLFFGCKIEVAPYQGYDVEDNEFRPYEAELDEYHPKSTRTLFIGNLEKDITSSELRKHFDCFGEIIEIDIKKQGTNAYAFCQYSDIVSVVKAMRKMDGEHLGSNRIKLGFGKSMPTSCVWIDGIIDNVSENYLSSQFSRYGPVSQVVIDRDRKLALVFFDQIQYAQAAVKEMRGALLRGKKLQVDFASRECQETFYDKLDKQASGTRFSSNRYDSSQSRSRTSSFSRHNNSTVSGGGGATSPNSNVGGNISGNTGSGGSTTVGGSNSTPRGRSRNLRHISDYEYSERRFRSYDEYSQGSGTSHDDDLHTYSGNSSCRDQRSNSPQLKLSLIASSNTDALEVNSNSGRRRCDKSPGDIRNLQKERSHLLEQLEECPSSGDELVSPKKRMKFDYSSHHHNHHNTVSNSLQSQQQQTQSQQQQQHTNSIECSSISSSSNNSSSLPPTNSLLGDSNCDALSNHSNESSSAILHHRKCVEVRRLSECSSLKYATTAGMGTLSSQQQLSLPSSSSCNRRPSIESGIMVGGSGNGTIAATTTLRQQQIALHEYSNTNTVAAGFHSTAPHSVSCKRRRTSTIGGTSSVSSSGSIGSETTEYHASRGRGHQLHSHHSHEASGGESADGSRPGTPLCDERPEVLPSEPRRIPRERPHEPMLLPLPKFGIPFFQQHRTLMFNSSTLVLSLHSGQLYSSINSSNSSSSSTPLTHAVINNNNITSNSNCNLTSSTSTLLNSSSHSSLSNTLSSPPLLAGTRLSTSSFNHHTTQSGSSSLISLSSSSHHHGLTVVQHQSHHQQQTTTAQNHHHHHHHGQSSSSSSLLLSQSSHYHHGSLSSSSLPIVGSSNTSGISGIEPPPQSPLRPRSLSSNSSDSDIAPISTSPSIEERIKKVDEMYEKWSGSSITGRNHSSLNDSSHHHSSTSSTNSYSSRHHKFFDLDVNEVKPSEIVKSVLAKKSIFDDDLQRLKNISDKYEPSDFSHSSRSSIISSSPGIPNLATVTKTPIVGINSSMINKQQSASTTITGALPLSSSTVNQQLQQRLSSSPMNSPQAISPYNSPSPSPIVSAASLKGIIAIQPHTSTVPQSPAAKGLQYPFPSHPPIISSSSSTTNMSVPVLTQSSTAPSSVNSSSITSTTITNSTSLTQKQMTTPPPVTSSVQIPYKSTPSEICPVTKPKISTMTKSFSVPEKSSSSPITPTTPIVSGNTTSLSTVTTQRSLMKSVSVPGSTNTGTVKLNTTVAVTCNTTVPPVNQHTTKNEDDTNTRLQQQQQEFKRTNIEKSSGHQKALNSSTSSSKKSEKMHKHNHRSDSSDTKKTKEKPKSFIEIEKTLQSQPYVEEKPSVENTVDKQESHNSRIEDDKVVNKMEQEDKENAEKERQERLARERLEREKLEKERQRQEKERLERERKERDKQQQKREKEEKEQEESEKRERDERERREREEKERRQQLELQIQIERERKEQQEERECEEKEKREREEHERKEKVENERKEQKQHDQKERDQQQRSDQEKKGERNNEDHYYLSEADSICSGRKEKDDKYRMVVGKSEIFAEKQDKQHHEGNKGENQENSIIKGKNEEYLSTSQNNKHYRDEYVHEKKEKRGEEEELSSHCRSFNQKDEKHVKENNEVLSTLMDSSSGDHHDRGHYHERYERKGFITTSPARAISAGKRRLSSQDSVENEEMNTKRSRLSSGDNRSKVLDRRDSKETSSRSSISKYHKTIHNRAGSLGKNNEEKLKDSSNFDETNIVTATAIAKKNKEHKKHDRISSSGDKTTLSSHKHKKHAKDENPTENNEKDEEMISTVSYEKNSFDFHHNIHNIRSSEDEDQKIHEKQKHKTKKDHKEKKRNYDYEEIIGGGDNNNGSGHRSRKHDISRHSERNSKTNSRSATDANEKSRSKTSSSVTPSSRKSSIQHPQSSNDSDSDEPINKQNKHSIFDILDDGPYISMYDKVKARSCKNMQKQEEEKKIKAKFTQLKQSRAKREEKKRSTSYDGDSDSDFDAGADNGSHSNGHNQGGHHTTATTTKYKHQSSSSKINRNCGFISSSDDGVSNVISTNITTKRDHHQHNVISDSDSDIHQSHHRRTSSQYNRTRLNELCDGDSSESSSIPLIRRNAKKISSKRNSRSTRIASDSSEDNDEVDEEQKHLKISSSSILSRATENNQHHIEENQDSSSVDVKIKSEIKSENDDENSSLSDKKTNDMISGMKSENKTVKAEFPKILPSSSLSIKVELNKEIKSELLSLEQQGIGSNEYCYGSAQHDISESENTNCFSGNAIECTKDSTFDQLFSPETRKKHKKSKKRQKSSPSISIGDNSEMSVMKYEENDDIIPHIQSKSSPLPPPTSLEHVFDELKRESILSAPATTPPVAINSCSVSSSSVSVFDKKKHKDRKEKKREKSRDDDNTKSLLTKEERHKLKKLKKSKCSEHITNRYPFTAGLTTTISAVAAVTKRSSGEKMEDIFGPISDEESQLSASDSNNHHHLFDITPSVTGNSTSMSGTSHHHSSSSHIQQPIVSAAINPYNKQEPLTPKSHTVEENEGNKQKSPISCQTGNSSHLLQERDRHRKEKRERKRKEREKNREQQQQQEKSISTTAEDDNSVDLDEAGRALEAQLMNDSDTKVLNEDMITPSTSTATTHKGGGSDMPDVFRFSDGDENSMEIMANAMSAQQEKKELSSLLQQEVHRTKDKKKKKKRSKEERYHQKREHHHHGNTSSHNSSLMSPSPMSTILSSNSKLSIEINNSNNITNEDIIAKDTLCKPSPSLPCLLDDDINLNSSPPSMLSTLHKQKQQQSPTKELNVLVSNREKNLISPISKTSTIIIPKPTVVEQQKKKPADKFIPGFDVELDEKISESAVKSISNEFTLSVIDPVSEEPKIPVESPPDLSKTLIDKMEEKSRVVISQEETEDAVAALLGESFGTSSAPDYSYVDDTLDVQPEENIDENIQETPIIPEEEGEEIRKAVQSLSNEDIDIKPPDTPQSENDGLQIDTDTEEPAEDTDTNSQMTQFDNPPKTPDVDLSQIKQTTVEVKSSSVNENTIVEVEIETSNKLPSTKPSSTFDVESKRDVTDNNQLKLKIGTVEKKSSEISIKINENSAALTPTTIASLPVPPSAISISSTQIPISPIVTTTVGITQQPQQQSTSLPLCSQQTTVYGGISNSSSSPVLQLHQQKPLAEQQQQSPQVSPKITSNTSRAPTQYAMQPPTISIPPAEQQQHFVYSPINVMVSPRQCGGEQQRMPSPRLPTQSQSQQQTSNSSTASQQSGSSNSGGAQYSINVRVPSPHSPNIHHRTQQQASIRHQSQLSPVVHQQHVVLQQRHQQQPSTVAAIGPITTSQQQQNNSVGVISTSSNIILNRMPVTTVLAPISKPIQPTNIILPQPSTVQHHVSSSNNNIKTDDTATKEIKLSSGQTITLQAARVNTPILASSAITGTSQQQQQSAVSTTMQIQSQKTIHHHSSPIKSVIETHTANGQTTHIQHIIPMSVQQPKPVGQVQHQTVVLQQQQSKQQQIQRPQSQIQPPTPQKITSQQQQILQQHQFIQQQQQRQHQMQQLHQQIQQQHQHQQKQMQHQQQATHHAQMMHLIQQQQKQHMPPSPHRIVQQHVLQMQQYQQQQQQSQISQKESPHKTTAAIASSTTSIIQSLPIKDGGVHHPSRIPQNVVIVRQQNTGAIPQQSLQKVNQNPQPQQQIKIQQHIQVHQQQYSQLQQPQRQYTQQQQQAQPFPANTQLQQQRQLHNQKSQASPQQQQQSQQVHMVKSASPDSAQTISQPLTLKIQTARSGDVVTAQAKTLKVQIVAQHSPQTQSSSIAIQSQQQSHSIQSSPAMLLSASSEQMQHKVQQSTIGKEEANQPIEQNPIIRTPVLTEIENELTENDTKEQNNDLSTVENIITSEHKDEEINNEADKKVLKTTPETVEDNNKINEKDHIKNKIGEIEPVIDEGTKSHSSSSCEKIFKLSEPEQLSFLTKNEESSPSQVMLSEESRILEEKSSSLTEENITKLSPPQDDELEQDSKEDSDYWSAKELNIDSVIKKVDALCSNDEIDDSPNREKNNEEKINKDNVPDHSTSQQIREKSCEKETSTVSLKNSENEQTEQKFDESGQLECPTESSERSGEKSEDTHDDEEDQEESRVDTTDIMATMRSTRGSARRGRPSKSATKKTVNEKTTLTPSSSSVTITSAVASLNVEGVQTRRGTGGKSNSNTQNISSNGTARSRRGRPATKTIASIPSSTVPIVDEKKTRNQFTTDQDVYEFHEDSGEETTTSTTSTTSTTAISKSTERPRLILTIKSPGQASTSVVTTTKSVPNYEKTKSPSPQSIASSTVQVMPTDAQQTSKSEKEKEAIKDEFSTPAANTRKSRRLQEKDGNMRNTVDDVIEDVVRNSLNSPKSGVATDGQIPPRRSTRNSQNANLGRNSSVSINSQTIEKTASLILPDVRKSPRANRRTKDRKSSDASIDSCDERPIKVEEKSKSHPLSPQSEQEMQESIPKKEEVSINEFDKEKELQAHEQVVPDIDLVENSEESANVTTTDMKSVVEVDRAEKSLVGATTESSEPMTLIDPVTGVLTVVQQSIEGQYVPVSGTSATSSAIQQTHANVTKIENSHVEVSTTTDSKVETQIIVEEELKLPSEIKSPVISSPSVVVSHESEAFSKGNTPVAFVTKSPSPTISNKTTSVVIPSSLQPTPSSTPISVVSQPHHIPVCDRALIPQQQQPQPVPQPQPVVPQPTIRTHPLKAHMLNAAVQLKDTIPTTKPVVVTQQPQSQVVVKTAANIINQTTPVVVNPNLIEQPSAIIQTNIVSRHLQQNTAAPVGNSNSSQIMVPGTQQSTVVQQPQHSHLVINIPPSNSPHTTTPPLSAAHSPRIQQSMLVKQQQQPMLSPHSHQSSPTSQPVVHVVSKSGSQQQQHISVQQTQHQSMVIQSQKIPQGQCPYNAVTIQTAVTVQSAGGKHQTIQIPLSHIQSQQQQHVVTHIQKHQQQPSGISVVSHPVVKQGSTPSVAQAHLNSQHSHLLHQQQTATASIVIKQQQQSSQIQIGNVPAQQQTSVVPGATNVQHIIAHAAHHQSSHGIHQPTGSTPTPIPLQAKPAHNQQQVIPPTAKGVIGLHQSPQIMTGAVASPPLKQSHVSSQQPVVTGAASSLRASVPPISPQGQATRAHILQPGLPVPAFEANLHDIGSFSSTRSQSPPPAHQQTSPITPGEGTFSTSTAVRGISRDHFIMYQQYLRAQEALGARIPYVSRSPLLPGSTDQKDMSDVDESIAASPPLELRRPGSGPRTIAVPHSLQSPQDRATDSPQVAQVYVHGTRIPHPHYSEVGARYYDNIRQVPTVEPPPAHRSAHSVISPSATNYAVQGAATVAAVGGPPVTLTQHMHSKALERERDREHRERERDKERQSLPGHTSMPSHGSLVPAMPTPTGRNIQVATPPHASQVPPQADSLLMLLQRYPVMWQGLLALKTDQAAVQMHFVFGNPHVARGSLPCNSDGSTPPLRIAQRMRLEQTQLEGVAKKMQYENEHCMLLALPCGRDHMDVLQQSRNLQTGFITYLQQKMAAGIVNIPVPGSEQAAYVVHIFPSCDFANENLERAAPDLKHRVAEIAHLLIVIATV